MMTAFRRCTVWRTPRGGGDISAFTERLCAEVSTRYLCRRKGRKPAIREELLERYSAELAEACSWLRGNCEGYCLSVRRRVSMARIEFPLLSDLVDCSVMLSR